jgi:hypothetical protein
MFDPRFTTTSPLTIDEAARRIGGYKWLEMRLFEVFGSAMSLVKEPQLKVVVGEQCYHHAWHAELWHTRLPALREMSGDQFAQPAHPGVEQLLEAISLAEDSLELFTGVYRVLLPYKIAAYTDHLANTSPITDGPTIRSLHQVLTDEMADWRIGQSLLQSLLGHAEDVDRVAAFQARLEKMVVGVGLLATKPEPI